MTLAFYGAIAYAALAGVEAWHLRRTGKKFSLNVAISNMSCGVLMLCVNGVYVALFAILYGWANARTSLIAGLGWQWWNLTFVFVLIDLCYYAHHRASHRVAFLWGAHVVHHESDEYNLTVSLRQGSVALFTGIPFYLAPAVIGVPLPVFLAVTGVYHLYQFFVHTAVVKDMGWLEHVLATPRLHRLHHARNVAYIDCNYSGFLILWDKLLGTYRPPSVEPVYGVTEPLRSWSPLWANLAYFQELISKARSRRGWDRLWTFIGPPEWHPAAELPKVRQPYVAYDASPRAELRSLAIAAFGASVILAILLTGPAMDWSSAARTILVLSTAAATLLASRLFDGSHAGRFPGLIAARTAPIEFEEKRSINVPRNPWQTTGAQDDHFPSATD
jgi:sterol desaturase/sphingolipid hydroxylase (fatty acid hydroxylase superfamily)